MSAPSEDPPGWSVVTASQPWAPEQLIDSAHAARLIDAQCPALWPVTVEPFAEGWDNTAFRVNGDWIFRFPRRQVAVAGLETELAVLPELAPALPLAIPVPEQVGRPGSDFPWPFAGYRELSGETACRAGLDDEARARLAAPLGACLRVLHSVELPAALQARLPLDPFGKSLISRRRQVLLDRLDQLEVEVGAGGAASLPLEEIRQRVHLLGETAGRRGPPVLVHGDLYARHLIVDGVGALTGIIDWGDLHLGDPALDLSLARSFLPATARESFFAAYGPVDARTRAAARFQALSYGIILSLFGLRTGDRPLASEGRRALLGALD